MEAERREPERAESDGDGDVFLGLGEIRTVGCGSGRAGGVGRWRAGGGRSCGPGHGGFGGVRRRRRGFPRPERGNARPLLRLRAGARHCFRPVDQTAQKPLRFRDGGKIRERDGSRGRLVPASDLSVSFYWLVLVVRAVVLVIGGREYFPNVGPTVPRDLDQLGMETDGSFCSGPNPPLYLNSVPVTSRVGSGRPS